MYAFIYLIAASELDAAGSYNLLYIPRTECQMRCLHVRICRENDVARDDDRDHGIRRRDNVRGDHRQCGRPTGPARRPGIVGRVLVQEWAGQATSRHVQVGVVDAQETRRQCRLRGGW